ncbi:zona pellucida sperm-binding protein 4-like isoform X1 [Brienomyrus brachyistius]|uniref:zona pellucida sperm-binding protein 4-like isoform X1 n=1 Tax=Brienomyrus brachyistius TaxID=42636 RepID=UPI0020B4548A|nr:zona pellucida sperm-binding protein 4-like isoform X1 [Brienomyrus brachyistius]
MADSRCFRRFWARASVLLVAFAVSFAQQPAVKGATAAAAAYDKCQVYEKVPCGAPAIGKDACAAINCCFDGQQCYYGNAVTVQCTRDGQFVVVVAKDSTVPQLDVTSISMLGGNAAPCSPVATTASFGIFTFPVTACGTVVKVDGDYIVYENRMSSTYEVGVGPLGSITRDSLYALLFRCRYWGTEVVSLVAEYQPVAADMPLPMVVPGPLRVELRLANGQCLTKGCDEGAVAYTSYYQDSDYPVTKWLRQPVYVEVRLLNRMDPNLVLLLDSCWATPTPDPLSLPQWSLLEAGCPNPGDKYLTTLVPVDGSSGLPFPAHYKRFIVQMFAFVDSTSKHLQGQVFFHCSTAVCVPSATDSCEQRCFRKGRDAVAPKDSRRTVVLVSSGEVTLTMKDGHRPQTGKW